MDKPTLFITCIPSRKSVVVDGLVAVREREIDVYIRGGAALIESGLILKIQENGNKGNTAPAGHISVWEASGLDAKGVMSLNTREAIAAFANASNTDQKSFNILVFTTASSKLECNGLISIMNFPSAIDEEPTTLDQAATIESLMNELQLVLHHSEFNAVNFLNGDSSLDHCISKINEIITKLKGYA